MKTANLNPKIRKPRPCRPLMTTVHVPVTLEFHCHGAPNEAEALDILWGMFFRGRVKVTSEDGVNFRLGLAPARRKQD